MEKIHTVVENPEYKKYLKEGDGIGTPATRAAINQRTEKKKVIWRRKAKKSAHLLTGLNCWSSCRNSSATRSLLLSLKENLGTLSPAKALWVPLLRASKNSFCRKSIRQRQSIMASNKNPFLDDLFPDPMRARKATHFQRIWESFKHCGLQIFCSQLKS